MFRTPFSYTALSFKESSDETLTKKEIQYILGRDASKAALISLGESVQHDVARGLHGEPVFPPGYVGSIAHSNRKAVALVGHKKDYFSLGVDYETKKSKHPQHLLEYIGTEEEIEMYKHDPSYFAVPLFSLKESVYKAIFPLVKRYISFKEVTFEIGRDLHNAALLQTKIKEVDPARIIISLQSIEDDILASCALTI